MPIFHSLSFWICMNHRLVDVLHCSFRVFFLEDSPPPTQFADGIWLWRKGSVTGASGFSSCGGWTTVSQRSMGHPVKRREPTCFCLSCFLSSESYLDTNIVWVGAHKIEWEREWVQEGTTWASLQNKAIKKFSKCPVYISWLLEGMVQIVLVFCIPRVRPVNWALAMWQKLL